MQERILSKSMQGAYVAGLNPESRRGGEQELRPDLGLAMALIAMLFSLVLLSGCGTGGELASSGSGGTEIVDAGGATTITKVAGVEKEITASREQSVEDKVSIEPAWGRTVELQYLDPASGQWQTQSTYTTANERKAKVTLDYGEGWKSHMASTWRVHVPEAQLTVGVMGTEAAEPASAGAAEETTAESSGGERPGEVLDAGEYAATVKVRLSDPLLTCKAAVVMDAESGQLLFDYNAKKHRKIASTTKMMTAILLTEDKALADPVKITGETAKTPWGVGLRKGDTVTVEDLLYAMMLPSANDAATASGIAVSGSNGAFVQRMDERAAELGCTDTVYKNANGLDKKGAHSTALDQARIARYIMTDPSTEDIRKAVRTWKKTFKSKKGLKYRLENTDVLLKAKGRYRSHGVKTGSTDDAGCCFAGAFTIGGRQVITVELGSQTGDGRWQTTRELVDIAAYAIEHGLGTFEL